MKKKSFNKKLSISKSTVAHLNQNDLQAAMGGKKKGDGPKLPTTIKSAPGSTCVCVTNDPCTTQVPVIGG